MATAICHCLPAANGSSDVVQMTNLLAMQRVAMRGASDRQRQTGGSADHALTPLVAVPADRWRLLAEQAIEPNAYYLPDWELAVDASAQNRSGVAALTAWSDLTDTRSETHLIGLLPVISAWRAYRLPLAALASADPYGTLSTPLLDRNMPRDAAIGLLQQARSTGARALILRDVSLDGPAMKALTEALRETGLRPRILQSHVRACLDATQDAERLLRDALGAKILKDRRRQRNRLAEHGKVVFEVARTPDEVALAVETFLALEASGWKARRGTALGQHAGDTTFIRRATRALAERGECEIVSLRAGQTPVAAAIITRHMGRAFYFKLGIDERFAKFSPGVQLSLDLTRHLCADPAIVMADSTASAGHPMIGPIWRGRLAIGDVMIPLHRRDPIVALIHAALIARRLAREPLRRIVHSLRKRQEKLT